MQPNFTVIIVNKTLNQQLFYNLFQVAVLRINAFQLQKLCPHGVACRQNCGLLAVDMYGNPK